MSTSPTARFVVGGTDPTTESRIRYAFSAYAALHGIRVLPSGSADVVVTYGPDAGPGDVALAAGYRPRPLSVPAPAPVWVDHMPCFHLAEGGEPDLLGEAFEWMAAPHEAACSGFDEIGRVPPQRTLCGTHGLDRTVPWANRWLARVHAEIRAVLPRLPADPPSPFGSGRTFVASHDLDHLSVDPRVNARRLVKNIGIALVRRHDTRTAAQIVAATAGRAARRKPTTVGLVEVLSGEAERGIRASYAVVAESTHPHDPGYTLNEDVVRRALAAIAADGHEICVHGSFNSLSSPGQLAREYRLLDEAGFPAAGGRQHWLRHRNGELFEALAAVGARWDSTCGHPDDIGFRRGVGFPFLPYDFTDERAHHIVEIPLVVMERALCNATRDPSRWAAVAADVLRAACEHGWGGVAVLWHDYAFTGTSLPRGLADAYWALLDHGDRWVTANEVADAVEARWRAAGAFTGSRPGAAGTRFRRSSG